MNDYLASFFENYYYNKGRKFSFRQTDEPYNILISEIMLQKTPAERVEEIYPHFIKKFPNLVSLSESNLMDIEYFFRNLGLLKRAVYLKRLSKIILAEFKGKIPFDKKLITSLPGIGEYTAGAILCFAFDAKVVFLDSNIFRIIRRLTSSDNDPSNKGVSKTLENILDSVKDPKAFYRGVLDYCSHICKDRSPKCDECSLKRLCNHYLTVL